MNEDLFLFAHFSLVHDDEKEAIVPESTNLLFLILPQPKTLKILYNIFFIDG